MEDWVNLSIFLERKSKIKLIYCSLCNQIKLIQTVYQKTIEHEQSTTVNVSLMASEYPTPCMSLYDTSKAGLSAFTQSLMLECRTIQLIDLKPGDFGTIFSIKCLENLGLHPQHAHNLINKRKKLATPEKAAKKLRYLLSKSRTGSYRTGVFTQSVVYPKLVKFLPKQVTDFATLGDCLLQRLRISGSKNSAINWIGLLQNF